MVEAGAAPAQQAVQPRRQRVEGATLSKPNKKNTN
jgi:hypothetical protein